MFASIKYCPITMSRLLRTPIGASDPLPSGPVGAGYGIESRRSALALGVLFVPLIGPPSQRGAAGILFGDAVIGQPMRTVFIVRRPPHPAVNRAVSSVGVLSIG